jgi:hypothetical protein
MSRQGRQTMTKKGMRAREIWRGRGTAEEIIGDIIHKNRLKGRLMVACYGGVGKEAVGDK